MKKLGWYFMSIFPLLSMIGIQLIVTVAVMTA